MKHYFAVKRDDAALDRRISVANLQPLMSNAKWVKLLTTLVTNWQVVQACKVKLIWEDATVERELFINEYTTYQFDHYTGAMEAMISGIPKLGWADYKEIEWLDFPKLPHGKATTQDLKIIQQKIEEVGHFQLDASPDNLRLYAYQRP